MIKVANKSEVILGGDLERNLNMLLGKVLLILKVKRKSMLEAILLLTKCTHST